MAYGIIEYNALGLPKCELCGQYFKRVLCHVKQKHFMTEREYKIMFGFDVRKGIISQESKLKSREAVLKNADKCIHENLLKKGKQYRFETGSAGRTKTQVSEQTRSRLSKHAQTNITNKQREEQGRKLGLSGLGNLARWGNKKYE